MVNEILLYIGSGIIILWGLAHIAPTKGVVSGFGDISADNKHIITMEWIAEGLALCFIGVLVLSVTIWGGAQDAVSRLVYHLSAAMLIIMSVLSLFTGARTSIIPIKICPVVKTTVAVLFIIGSII